MPDKLPPYATRELIEERLPIVFPEGIPNRSYCIRRLSASKVFAMLHIGAVEGTGRYLGPVHIHRMANDQTSRSDNASRIAYGVDVLRRGHVVPGARWYADNNREPIRGETLREGLLELGAVRARENLQRPRTSRAMPSRGISRFCPTLGRLAMR